MNIHRKTLEALNAGIASEMDENQIIQVVEDEESEIDSVHEWEPRSATWEADMPVDNASKARYIFDEVLRMYEDGKMSGNWRYVGEHLSAEKEKANANAREAAAMIKAFREEINPPNGSLPESERIRREIEHREDFCLNIPAGDSKEVAFAMADLGKKHHLPVHVVAIEHGHPDSSDGRGSKAMHYIALVSERDAYIQRVGYSGSLRGLPQEECWIADVWMATFDTLSGYTKSVVANVESLAQEGFQIRLAQDQEFFEANDVSFLAALGSSPENYKVRGTGYCSIENLEIARSHALETEAREAQTHEHARVGR